MKDTTIKKIREKLGISQIALSKAIGISTSAIGNYETCFRKPRLDIAFRIINFANAHGLKLNLEDIYSPTKQ